MKLRILATSAILAASVVLNPVAASAACSPGTSAIQYLAANQLPDGSLDMTSAGGFGNPTATEDLAIGAAALGLDPNTLQNKGKTAYEYFAANGAAETANVGRAAKLVLALVAGNTTPGRYDYDNFGGVHPITIINTAYLASGRTAGAFADGSAFGQALAILALKGAGAPVPPAALTWLRSIRNTGRSPASGGYPGELSTDTGWSYGTAADQHQGDTNTTAEALQALSAAGDESQDGAALAFLHNQQNPDGGFPLQQPSAFGTASDADSDALVLEALAATRQSLASWTVAGLTPLANLASMQDPRSGGFPGTTPDTFTTSQVPQGLAQAPGPVHAVLSAHALPAAGCSSPSPSPTSVVQAISVVPGLPRAGHPSRSDIGSWPAGAVVVLVAAPLALLGRRRMRR